MRCEFHNNTIHFLDYPFIGATVYPRGEVSLSLIASIDAAATPPEVRLKTGEILFVEAAQRRALEEFTARNFVPVIARLDVWALILAPWVDTELEDEADEQGLKSLESCGIARAEIVNLRNCVGPAMAAYNFQSGLWDWANLNLFDALNALSGLLAGSEFKLEAAPFAEFYWHAMKVAAHGRTL